MFASENLLLHDLIATLELKGGTVRWYAKEAILTDRALYLYKRRSNYVHDAHSRLSLAQYRAQRARPASLLAYRAELPPLVPPFESFEPLVELFNLETARIKLLACQSEEKADRFVKLVNLVAAFTAFEGAVAAQREVLESSGATGQAGLGLPSQADQRRIERWVQDYVLEREGHQAGTLTFTNEGLGSCSQVLRLLGQHFKDTVTSLAFVANALNDAALSAGLAPLLVSFQRLTHLEITGNDLTSASLETLGRLFQSCRHITTVSLSRNRIGGGQPGSGSEKQCMGFFLSKLFTELQGPRSLDLSYNSLTDECLYPVIKYIFANHECGLRYFNLEHNSLSPRGSRTLLKAQAISPGRDQLVFRYGPLPLSLENLRAGFVTQQDTECIPAIATMASERVELTAHQETAEKVSEQPKALELVIQRRSNNFFGSGNTLKPAPVARAESQKLEQYLARVESIVQKRGETEIEALRDFVQEVTGPEISFEIPRYRLEPIFNVVNEKLEAAIENENIYVLEVLLDCLKFMNARNIPAEKKYYELAHEAQGIAHALLQVLNLEIKDESEMQRLLVQNLRRGKQIGLRGELIDTARHLYLLTEKVLGEMRGQAAAVSDDEDETIYEVNEEERPPNVYDQRLDKYVDRGAEELGLTSDVEAHLAFHPYCTDYLLIANLNLNYVRKNLAEAKRFLKDEESYSYRNIFERCSVLLSDAGEHSLASITYNLARNDSNLKLARLIFRYKNNLDKHFPAKGEVLSHAKEYVERLRNQDFREPQPRATEEKNILKHLAPGAGVTRNLSGRPLERGLTRLDPAAGLVAVKFNRKLVEVLKGDAQAPTEAKLRFYTSIQELFEDFVIQGLRPPGSKKLVLLNRDLSDEFYLQLYRQADFHMSNLAQKQGQARLKEFFNSLLIFALLSNYIVPSSRSLHEGIFAWLVQLRAKMDPTAETFRKIIVRTLNNFNMVAAEDSTEKTGTNGSRRSAEQESEETDDRRRDPGGSWGRRQRPSAGGLEAKFDSNLTGVATWPPSTLEIESLVTGQPISIQVQLANGELLPHIVDEATTVESLLDSIRESHPYFKCELETDTFWLFRQHLEEDGDPAESQDGRRPQELDFPLPKDKKILKLMYQAEREAVLRRPVEEAGHASGRSLAQGSTSTQAARPALSSTVSAASAGQTLEGQKCALIVKRRLFPSLYLLKNFKRLHVRALDQVFHQVRADHVDKCLLKDVCAPDDLIYFGALILKVKLQAKILRSKQNKISLDLILKNIDHAIPSCFIERHGRPRGGRGRAPDHWASKIEDGFFRKKEFLDYSLEDAQEKFLSGIGLYNLMFSSYYVLEKGGSPRKQAEKRQVANRRASKMVVAHTYVRMGTVTSATENRHSGDESFDSSEAMSSASSGHSPIRLRAQETIVEAGSADEESSDDPSSGSGHALPRRMKPPAGSAAEKGHPPASSKVKGSALSTLSKARQRKAAARRRGSIWSAVQDEQILLVVNLQGVQVLENSTRERVVHHIDFEDIISVMGKGNRLKLSFLMQAPGQHRPVDCRTEFRLGLRAGHKARSIAEDIVAYAQLRLVEMTKNNQAEFFSRYHAPALFDKLEAKELDHQGTGQHQHFQAAAGATGTIGTDDELDVQAENQDAELTGAGGQPRDSSFQGLRDMQIKQEDLLDSFDLEEEAEILDGLGEVRAAERLPDAGAAEQYAKTISGQLGKCLKFKVGLRSHLGGSPGSRGKEAGGVKLFAYSRRNPLLLVPGQEDLSAYGTGSQGAQEYTSQSTATHPAAQSQGSVSVQSSLLALPETSGYSTTGEGSRLSVATDLRAGAERSAGSRNRGAALGGGPAAATDPPGRQRIGGSLSKLQGFNLQVAEHSRIEELQDESYEGSTGRVRGGEDEARQGPGSGSHSKQEVPSVNSSELSKASKPGEDENADKKEGQGVGEGEAARQEEAPRLTPFHSKFLEELDQLDKPTAGDLGGVGLTGPETGQPLAQAESEGRHSSSLRPSQSNPNSKPNTGPNTGPGSFRESKRESTGSKKVDFSELGSQQERAEAASALLSQALQMAPPLDSSDEKEQL